MDYLLPFPRFLAVRTKSDNVVDQRIYIYRILSNHISEKNIVINVSKNVFLQFYCHQLVARGYNRSRKLPLLDFFRERYLLNIHIHVFTNQQTIYIFYRTFCSFSSNKGCTSKLTSTWNYNSVFTYLIWEQRDQVCNITAE